MELVLALIGVAVIVAIRWPGFTRDRGGGASALSVIALLVFVLCGNRQGADAPAPWPLLGLAAGVILYILAEFMAARQRDSAASNPE